MRRYLQENFYLLTALMLTAVFLSNDAFLPAIPEMAKEFGSPAARLQQGVAFFILGALVLQIFVGPFSDRYGRRPVMLGGAVMFLLGSLGCIFARNVEMFLLARIIQGSAMASTQVSAMAAINEYYERNKAISAMALSANINLLAPVLGPIFGAMILSLPIPAIFSFAGVSPSSPWRMIFIYTVFLGLFATIMLALYMPEPGASRRIQHAAPKSNLFYIFRQIPKIISNKTIALYSISLAIGGFAMLLWITGAPVMLIENLGLSENTYAWMQVPIFTCTIIGNSIAPGLARRLGGLRHMTIMHGFLILISPFIFLIAFFWQDSALALVLAFSLYSFSLGAINAVKNQFVISLSEYKGSVTSVLMLFNSCGIFLGSLTASLLGGLPNHYSFAIIAIASFAVGFFALLANFFLRRV